jgi:hypothetical protein
MPSINKQYPSAGARQHKRPESSSRADSPTYPVHVHLVIVGAILLTGALIHLLRLAVAR